MQRRHKVIIGIACAILVAVAVYQWLHWFREATSVQQRGSITVRKETIRLFSSDGTSRLSNRVLEVRSDIPDREKADIILRELKKDKVIAAGVQLRDAAVGLDGILYLNVSRNLAETYPGAPPEMLMVYSLVNSFTSNFKDVNKVQLLLDGEPVYTIGGVVYTYLPLEFNKDFMED